MTPVPGALAPVPLKTRLALALLRLATRLTRAVSRETAEPWVRLAGRIWFLSAPAARDAVAANLRQILGHAPPRALVRQVFEHGAYNYWDTFAIPQLSRSEIEAIFDADGWEHLDAALALGKGAVMFSGHLGSVALGSQLAALRGHKITGVVEPIQPPELFDFINDLRTAHGISLLPLGPTAAREMLQALRRNEVVGLITDRDVLGTGLPVHFFGARTTFPDGAASLALRTGAAIIPTFVVRTPGGRFKGIIEPPLEHPVTTDRTDLVARLTQAVADRLQYYVARHPEQWTVFQRRWTDMGVPLARR